MKEQETYSHGLEEIYAIKTVDVKSIKPMQRVRSTNVEEKDLVLERKAASTPVVEASSERFALGWFYADGIDSFHRAESIVVLELSVLVCRVLKDHGIKTVGEVLDLDLDRFGFEKKVGQGHIDELKEKLESYRSRVVLSFSKRVNFRALLSSVTNDVDNVLAVFLAEHYGVSALRPLQTSERASIRRLTVSERKIWLERARHTMCAEQVVNKVYEALYRVIGTLVAPWLWKRGGVASSEELYERMKRIGDFECDTVPVLSCLEDMMGIDCIFGAFFVPTDSHLYAFNTETVELYQHVLEIARSYFYHDRASYHFDDLCAYIERESAKQWVGFRGEFVGRVLALCPQFVLYKNSESHKLSIRMRVLRRL